MGGKGKKRKAKQQQQSKGRNKSHAEPELSGTVVLKGRSGKRSLPLPGLSNLGNTCFFNSVMQNLGQSHHFRAELHGLLAKPRYTVEIKLPSRKEFSRELCVEGAVGPLAEKLSSFLTQMQTGGTVLNPRPVFSEISKKSPRFSGYHQQDSQELLRCLLDALRAEEIKRIKRSILTSYNVTGTKSEHLTDSDRTDIRAYGLQAHLQQTFVDRAFGGVLTSTVVCKGCRNKSSMHETFLDLSLPIGHDKSMSSSTHSRTGYQTRNKDKKKGDPSLPKARSELSKHQLKKQEKQARKANKKSLHKFLNDDSTLINSPEPPNSPELPQSQLTETELPVTQEGGNHGEDSNGGVEPDIVENVSSNLEVTGIGSVDYAAEGPLPDTRSTVIGDEEQTNVTQYSTEVHQVSEPTESVQPNVEATLAESLVHTFESLKVQPDSLEASLKKFCTPELLSGANKFACVVCTKLKYESQPVRDSTEHAIVNHEAMKDEDETVSASPDTCRVAESTAEGTLPDSVSLTEVTAADIESEADSSREGSEKTSPTSVNTHQHDDNSSVEADNEESSEDELTASPTPNASIVFSEATKQIMIEKPPLILTLHLKRFVQHSRRLQKNNKYVSFPPLLDMTPFCTASTELADVNEQLLYSLYGIVEHSGSMQGGHYIAYVKVRTPSKITHSSSTNPKDLPPDQSIPPDHSADQSLPSEQCQPPDQSLPPEHSLPSADQSLPPEQSLSKDGDVTESLTKDCDVTESLTIDCDVTESLTKDRDVTESLTKDCDVTESLTKDGDVTESLTKEEPVESKVTSLNESAADARVTNFDLSCTSGQWYYISDSHVRTATQNEVMKSQAYLLFYEKIPRM